MLNSEGIRHKLENLDKSIADYLSQLEDNDSNEDTLETAREEIKQLKEKIAKLEAQKAKFEAVGKTLEGSRKKQISPNDTDAVLVKGRDGKFAGYNAQTGVEGKGHFIMYNEVTTEANDLQLLENNIERVTEEIDIFPEEVLADKGYGNMTQILNIEDKGIPCYIPLQTRHREKEEKQDLVFKYDKESDTCTCPQGKKLYLFSKKYKHHGAIYNTYKCRECNGCPIRMNYTKSKTGRIYKRNIEQNRIDKYKEKLKTNYAREKIAERKALWDTHLGR